jgi:site-specific DNA-methyltransferase (adenine-specific)
MDCSAGMRALPAGSVGLIIADPPYNIGKAGWDKWPSETEYIKWCESWIAECGRVLKRSGVMYLWHNRFEAMARLLDPLRELAGLELVSFLVWPKEAWHREAWKSRRPESPTAPRSWINICDYVMHLAKDGETNSLNLAGMGRRFFGELIDWHDSELARLGLTIKDVEKKYSEATGRKPYMVARHYFCDSQFELPTREVWEKVYEPLGFQWNGGESELRNKHNSLREPMRQEYDKIRERVKSLRYTHHCDPKHCNVLEAPMPTFGGKRHPCEKPQSILSRFVRVSSNPGDVVLDPFAGSGSALVAAMAEGRRFIGFETEPGYCDIANAWIEEERRKQQEEAANG